MNRASWYLYSFVFFFVASAFFSCDSDTTYKGYEDLEDGLWYLKTTPTFKVEIKDTTQAYNLYYLVRNTLKYPYYNLYVTREVSGPDGKKTSTLSELFLSNEKTGKPYGNGLGDIFDHKIIFLRNHKFGSSGTYTFTFSQTMRQNPLPFVMGIGLSVERVPPGLK